MERDISVAAVLSRACAHGQRVTWKLAGFCRKENKPGLSMDLQETTRLTLQQVLQYLLKIIHTHICVAMVRDALNSSKLTIKEFTVL